MGDLVKLEDDTAPGVATIRVENGRMNPMSKQVVAETAEIAAELAGRDDIGGVVIWGGEKIFAAGADINEFPEIQSEAEGVEFSNAIHDAFLALENLPQITISAVNGYALGGGCELAMTTDFRVAGENAVFGQPEILLGIIPGAGGTQRLPRLVGITKAKELNYTGRQVQADEALAIGLVSEVVPDEQCYPRAIELAEMYAKGPKALQYCKKSMMDGLAVSLEEACRIEAANFGACFETEDRVAGVQSFLENGPGKAAFSRK